MPSARQKERRKKLLSGPRIWQREFIPPSASYRQLPYQEPQRAALPASAAL